MQQGGAITAGFTIGGAGIGLCVAGPKGMLIGGGIGLGVGVAVSSVSGGVQLFAEFEDWKASVESKGCLEIFKKIHGDLPALRPYYCPFTQDIIKDPVQLSCGHTFEKSMIEDDHDRNVNIQGGPQCPTCRSPYTKTQLTPDITYIGKIKKAYANVLKNECNNPLFSPPIVAGFTAAQKGYDLQAQEILKDVSTKLTLQLQNGDLTPLAFSRKIREVTEIFTEEESAK